MKSGYFAKRLSVNLYIVVYIVCVLYVLCVSCVLCVLCVVCVLFSICIVNCCVQISVGPASCGRIGSLRSPLRPEGGARTPHLHVVQHHQG